MAGERRGEGVWKHSTSSRAFQRKSAAATMSTTTSCTCFVRRSMTRRPPLRTPAGATDDEFSKSCMALLQLAWRVGSRLLASSSREREGRLTARGWAQLDERVAGPPAPKVAILPQ